MEPTRAPWADNSSACALNESSGEEKDAKKPVQLSSSAHTGSPVQLLISVGPGLPPVNHASWPTTWEPAKKCIRSVADVQRALKGATFRSFVAFTMSLNDAVIGVKNSDPCHISRHAQALLDALDRLSELVKHTPSVTHAVRYGNPAFRSWSQAMTDAAPELVYTVLGDNLGEATIEILPYFLDSFGNSTRIDYGTGHETAFVSFLYCLYCLGVLDENDRQATVTRIFVKYIALMREIQTTYWCALCLSSSFQAPWLRLRSVRPALFRI
jgi:serine/threonine-protein phosphatase 2A activator